MVNRKYSCLATEAVTLRLTDWSPHSRKAPLRFYSESCNRKSWTSLRRVDAPLGMVLRSPLGRREGAALLSNGGGEGRRVEPDWTAATAGLGSTHTHTHTPSTATETRTEKGKWEDISLLFIAESRKDRLINSAFLARWSTVRRTWSLRSKKMGRVAFLLFCPSIDVSVGFQCWYKILRGGTAVPGAAHVKSPTPKFKLMLWIRINKRSNLAPCYAYNG